MNLQKKVFLTITLLVIIIVVGIVVTAVYLIRYTSQESLPYNNTTIIGNTSLTPQYNVFTNTTTPAVSDSIKDLFLDWQDSANIRHSDYTPQKEQDAVEANQSIQNTNSSTNSGQSPGISEGWSSDIWSWIPKSTNHAQTQPTQKTPEASAIRTFGNSYGSTIKRFTTTLGDQPKVMQNFVEGRGKDGNTLKIISLGQKYIDVAATLTVIQAPLGFETTAHSLSTAYKKVGEATIILSKASDDADTVERILSYNSVVDDFARSYLALVDLFGAYGIKFTKGEGGDIFMPPM